MRLVLAASLIVKLGVDASTFPDHDASPWLDSRGASGCIRDGLLPGVLGVPCGKKKRHNDRPGRGQYWTILCKS